jgi:transposase-like protein
MEGDKTKLRESMLPWKEKGKKCPKCGVQEVVNNGGSFGFGKGENKHYVCLSCWHEWTEYHK